MQWCGNASETYVQKDIKGNKRENQKIKANK